MAKKKTTKAAPRRVSKSPALGAPYKNEQTFVTDCPKCSRVYTTDDINGGRCTGCGTSINDPYARAASTIKNAAKDAELRELRAANKLLTARCAKLEGVVTDIYDELYLDNDGEGNEEYNPNKEWDSAADYLEQIAETIATLIHVPDECVKERPEFIK